MYYFPNVDPIYIYKRKGTSEDPYIDIIDENNVRSGAIVLKEIPHFDTKVQATIGSTVLTEVESDMLDANDFRVDYTTGVAFFNSSQNSKKVKLEYLGTGYVSVPASRIWMIGEHDNPVESLEEVMDRVDEGVQVLDSMSEFRFTGDYLESSQYDKWNFAFYKNKTYVALEGSKGENPDESSKWTLVSSGVGFAGVHQIGKRYDIGDIVSDPNLKNIYFSKVNDNDAPVEDMDSWELMVTLDDIVESFDNKMEDVYDILESYQQAEDIRDSNEQERTKSFDELVMDVESLTDIIHADEENRVTNESERISKENNRQSNEIEREQSESNRKDAELTRLQAEASREVLFQQIYDEIQNAIDNAVTSIGNANAIMQETKEEVINALNDYEDISEMLIGEANRVANFKYVQEFDIEQEYKKDNIVEKEGSTYIALKDTLGNDVENVEYWGTMAKRGLSNIDITIDGLSPDEEGNISLEELDIVRNIDFEDRKEEVDESIGDMNSLNTLHKTSLVGAINELKKRIDDIYDVLD